MLGNELLPFLLKRCNFVVLRRHELLQLLSLLLKRFCAGGDHFLANLKLLAELVVLVPKGLHQLLIYDSLLLEVLILLHNFCDTMLRLVQSVLRVVHVGLLVFDNVMEVAQLAFVRGLLRLEFC